MIVLVVEDHDDTREGVVIYLRHNGFTVHEAATGLQAITTASKFRPNAILMDLGLPGMDGWEATRRLKRSPRTRHIPIVATSGFAFPADRERAMGVGCSHFLTKPFSMTELLATVRAVAQTADTKAVVAVDRRARTRRTNR